MRLHDFLEFHARERTDVAFAVMGDRRLTYAEADARANQLANAFIEAGLRKGDRFAYLSKNSLEYPIVYFAASKAGVAPVPLNYRLASPEWAYIVNDSQSKMLLSSGEYMEGIEGIRGELETVGRYVSVDRDGGSGWQGFGYGSMGSRTLGLTARLTTAMTFTRCTPAVPQGVPRVRCWLIKPSPHTWHRYRKCYQLTRVIAI